jgi:hypothetical protein
MVLIFQVIVGAVVSRLRHKQANARDENIDSTTAVI